MSMPQESSLASVNQRAMWPESQSGWPWSFVNVLLRRRVLILLVPMVAGIVTATVLLLTPREYKASASFVPQEPNSAVSGLGQLAAQFGLATPRAAMGSPQFYADLLLSREVVRELLLTTYTAAGERGFQGTLLQYFKIDGDSSDRAMVRGLRRLRSILTVRTNRSTGVVSFEVRTRLAALSVQVASRLLELVNDYNLSRRQSQGRAEREFVEQRLAIAQRELTAAESDLERFYSQNRRFTDSPELVAQEARLQRQLGLRQQVFQTLTQSYEAAKIEEVRNTPVITVIEQPVGFVERRARGTIKKTLFAGLGAGVIAVALAFALEYFDAARRARGSDYLEFETLWGQVASGLRGALGRRRR